MASKGDIRRRIRSITNTQKITKAMEMVAASKMRKAQEAALGTREYAGKALEILRRVSSKTEERLHSLLRHHDKGKTCIILISSDKGLCGGFNTNVLKAVTNFMDQESGAIDFITIGTKGRDWCRRVSRNIVAEFTGFSDKVDLLQVTPIAQIPLDDFVNKKYKKVVLIYTDFVSTLKQDPVIKSLLPLKESELIKLTELGTNVEVKEDDKKEESFEYLYEPSPYQVLATLLPRLVQMQIFQALLESNASEHSARMVAMKNASENAGEIIDDLTLTYNQARQAAITTQISEISAGVAALEK